MTYTEQVVCLLPWIRRQAFRYAANSVDAADLASDTILLLLEGEGKYNHRRDMKPWALSIMHNHFINTSRRRRIFDDAENTELELPENDNSVEYNEARMIISNLSKQHSSVCCVMKYASGYDYKEISQQMGIPVGTVKSRIHTGRIILRSRLV